MRKIYIGPINITNSVQEFVQRISNKTDPIKTLKYFTDLSIDYQDLVQNAVKESDQFFSLIYLQKIIELMMDV